jgi:hypothetical protein
MLSSEGEGRSDVPSLSGFSVQCMALAVLLLVILKFGLHKSTKRFFLLVEHHGVSCVKLAVPSILPSSRLV